MKCLKVLSVLTNFCILLCSFSLTEPISWSALILMSFLQKHPAHRMASNTSIKDSHLSRITTFRKLPVTVNLQTLRAKLETSNGKLLDAERRRIANLEVNLDRHEIDLV